MILPQKSELPLKAPDNLFVFDDAKVNEFRKAFRDQKTYLPPTLTSVCMKGIFDLLNRFQIDWRKLLHATQNFSYTKSIQIPSAVIAETTLVDLKSRASMIWFQFETKVSDQKSKEVLVVCKSLLMTGEAP